MKSSEYSNFTICRVLKTHSANYRATPSTPLFRRAALRQGRLPNVHGSKLFQSTDFWLIFTILSLCMFFQPFI